MTSTAAVVETARSGLTLVAAAPLLVDAGL
jgi:hypothetical protein